MLERFFIRIFQNIINFKFHKHSYILSTFIFKTCQVYSWNNIEVIVDYEIICTECGKISQRKMTFIRKNDERDFYSTSNHAKFNNKMKIVIKELIKLRHNNIQFRENDDTYC